MALSRTRLAAITACVVLAGLALARPPAFADGPPGSTVIGAAAEDYNTVHTASDGDLWPSCQSNDGHLYAANGDGRGFDTGGQFEDIMVSQITGTPAVLGSLQGTVVARGGNPDPQAGGGPSRSVGQVWTDPALFNRKPTGMLCVDSSLYLAVQDLRKETFNGAPAATLLRSTDHGRTWWWDTDGAMFTGGVFTTIFFVDYGRDSVNAPDRTYLYAYGLDVNWAGREDLFLARIPRASIMEASTWQWWTGNGSWSAPGERSTRQPVLHDDRLPRGRISQGGVVYDRSLGRYLYATWIENASDVTMHIYEAPAPWGPWSIAMTKNFGAKCLDHSRARWHRNLHGGYATTMPAKFVSSDGRTLWLQSNVLFIFDETNPESCPPPDPDLNAYGFSLRPVWLTTPDNLARDPGFEGQQQYQLGGIPLPLGPIGPPWTTEGPDSHGLDSGLGLSHQDTNNAWIHPANRASRAWNAITQKVDVTPGTRYTLSGWVQTSTSLTDGFFGVRHSDGRTVLQETRFGRAGPYTQLTVTFDAGDNSEVTLFAGYWSPGTDSWLRLDDLKLGPAPERPITDTLQKEQILAASLWWIGPSRRSLRAQTAIFNASGVGRCADGWSGGPGLTSGTRDWRG
jgi:hypothetical protein